MATWGIGVMREPSVGPIRVNRRTALQMATAAALGVWAGRPGLATDTPPRQRVLVLGAGLAGLTAALELARRGHDVRVLEGQDRIGGRVYSTSRGLGQGQIAEIGAARIPDIHDFTLHYTREFKLPTAEFPQVRSRFQVGGKAFLQPAPGKSWPLELNEPERADPLHFAAHRLAAALPDWKKVGADGPSAELLRNSTT